MGEKRMLWIYFHYAKGISAVLVLNPWLVYIFPKRVRINIQFYWLAIILILSSFVRFYREWFTVKERTRLQE